MTDDREKQRAVLGRGHAPVAAALMASALLAGCGPLHLPAPEVDGILWTTDSTVVGCSEDDPPGTYLPSEVTHVSAQRCRVRHMLFNCHAEHVARDFSIEDFATNDPGPWWRHGRQNIDLYAHNLGRGATTFSGSGLVTFDELFLHVWSSEAQVEASVGLFTPLSDIANDSVTLAEVDKFSDPRTITVTPTYELPINYTFEPRVAVWGEAHGENALFPFLVTSGRFRANGTVTADYTVCQEARLVNHDDQCLGPSGTGDMIGFACGQFGSGVSVHVHRPSDSLVLLHDLRCLTVDDTRAIGGRFPVVKRECSSGIDGLQQWTWSADGTLRANGMSGYCLAPDADRAYVYTDFRGTPHTQMPLAVQRCTGSAAERWRFF